MRVLGELIIWSGLLVMLCGLVGVLRYRSLYRRLLLSSLIDTCGLLLLLLGVAVRQGFSAFSLKVLLLMVVVLLTAPLITHKIGRNALLSGHQEAADDG